MYKIVAIGDLPNIRALSLIGVEWYPEAKAEDALKMVKSDKSVAILIISDDVYNRFAEFLESIKRPEFSVIVLGRAEGFFLKSLERKIERALGVRIFTAEEGVKGR
jgi:vacuolar-type H+-ATPase subunit F/Vma7